MRFFNGTRLLMGVLLMPAIVKSEIPQTANLALWLDASDIDGDGQTDDNPADGTAIGEGANPWVNKAKGFGVANALTAAEEGGDAPRYVANAGSPLNSQPALAFDGDSSGLKVAHKGALNATNGLTVFIVALDATNGFRFAQKGNGVGQRANDWFVSQSSGLGVAGVFVTSSYDKPQGAHIFEYVFDPASGVKGAITNLLDGLGRGPEVQLTNSYTNPNSDPLYIGRRYYSGGSQGWLGGKIAEILVYNTALVPGDRKLAGEYLATKYGIDGAYAAEPYAVMVMADRPVAYWRFEDASFSNGSTAANWGTAGTANNGVYRGDVTAAAGYSPRLGKAACFNGSTSYVELGFNMRNALNGASAVTVEAWVKNDTLPPDSSTSYFIMSNYLYQNQTGVRLAINHSDPRMNLGARSESGGTFSMGGANFSGTGKWCHVVGIADYSNNQLCVYVNGVATATNVNFTGTAYAKTDGSTCYDSIGAMCGWASSAVLMQRFFDGQIDEVAVYDYALSPEQIRAHYAVAHLFRGTLIRVR